jgi:hypothetical protein
VQATGGTGARSWSISAGNLPPGLDINQTTGEISGTPTAAGSFNFTAQVQDSGSPQQTDTQDLIILIAEPLAITTNTLSNTTEDEGAYSDTVGTSGGQPPLTFSLGSGTTLPPGLSLDGASGTISGNPTTGGSFTFEIQVTDSLSTPLTDSRSYTVFVLEVTTATLDDAVANISYNATFEVVGEVGAVTWEESTASFDDATGAGALGTPCEGLTVDFSNGTISGTPVNLGDCNFTIGVTDSDSIPRNDSQILSITVVEPQGRNDRVDTAIGLTLPPVGDETRILASISPYGDVTPNTPNAADNDFYRLTAPFGAELSIEIVARRLSMPSRLDSVIELVTDDGSDLGARILQACRESGDDASSTTGTVNGVDGSADMTPNDFDDDCINDDIVLGTIRDSLLEFRAPSGNPFFIRVLGWRGDARPDLVYELVINRTN